MSAEQPTEAPAAAPAAPAAAAPAAASGEKHAMDEALSHGYTESLLGCMADPSGFALACCCPCVPSAVLRTSLDERELHVTDFICGASGYANRQSMRKKFNMPRAPGHDCAAFLCCGPCAISQDIREYAKHTGKAAAYNADASTELGKK